MSDYDFTLSGLRIVKTALRKVNVLAEGEEPSNEQLEQAAEALNLAVKALQNDGVYLWSYEEATLNLVKGTSRYVLGADTLTVSNLFTRKPQIYEGGSAVSGSLDIGTGATVTAVSQGTTSFTVGTAHATTAGGSLTVTSAGLWSYTPPTYGSHTTTQTETFAYTITYAGATTAAGSLVLSVATSHANPDSNAPCTLLSSGDWAAISDRDLMNQNQPIYALFTPVPATIGTSTGPTLTFYEIPDDTYTCSYWRVRKLRDFDNLYSSTTDVWDRWLDVLIYGTAARLADEFGLELNRCQWLQQKADEFLRRARGGNREIQDSHITRSIY